MAHLKMVREVLGDPGRLYNFGNGLLLFGGIGGATLAALEEKGDFGNAGARIAQHFFGSPAAVALSLATLVFFASGLAYSRAWRSCGGTPNARLNKYGDILSGVGALILGCGLLMLGGALLAIIAGALNAAGKFGSALSGARIIRTRGGGIALSDFCKDVVMFSRLPAMLAALIGLATVVDGAHGVAAVVLSASLVVSTLYWGMADALLLRRNGPLMTAIRRMLRLRLILRPR